VCGRYYIDPDLNDPELARLLTTVKCSEREGTDACVFKTGEIFPTDVVPALTVKTAMPMKWGFKVFDKKARVINARLETIAEKPMFRQAFLKQRCLIPASLYYEWRKEGVKKRKIAIGTGKTIFMAGLYRIEEGTDLPVFVIVTRPANADIVGIHDRMPLILPADCREAWVTAAMDYPKALQCRSERLLHSAV
jgi:putative SOS response-associated peptidase YedK